MRKSCINCHFLSKEYVEDNTGRRLCFTIDEQDRNDIRKRKENTVKQYYTVECHKGVWRDSMGKEEFYNRVVKLKRPYCFFFPYQQDMMFAAADELQKREQERNELKRSNMYTRIGLILAAGGLFLNAFVNWCKI
ncbi:hypothetical protein CRN32_04100 [Vibrio vulnificus]|uniref:Uncharacterized protein n=1 Tax=Vibrio vulnificus TaxID=672 RepID=A0ABX4WWH4_VIBVL|nr:hypothetical protein [Vibrio vulnificus]EGQ9939744.1 hypothetical protein [Vibrio vulnificus]EGR0054810.1 hypothetical protein [Vibrio vulnificus]EHZ7124075.1 hypothetical protein [Vibrio vulnificus]EIA1774674.1 hypothetical protein [Vibrio vulnificus]EID4343234.1 hypothetical protein [Vibrio vulnificus]